MLKFNILKLKKDLETKLKREVTWEEISEATGISSTNLKRLASPTDPGVTNTANLEALCRYFKCGFEDLLKFSPARNRKTSCHVKELYPGRLKSADDGGES